MNAVGRPAIFHADNVYCITFWQNVAIVDARGMIGVPHVLTMEKAFRTLARRFADDGIVSCLVIQPGTPISPPDAIKEGARFIRDMGRSLVRAAVVIEDVGVVAQLLRTVVRGVNLINHDNKVLSMDHIAGAVDAIAPFIVPSSLVRDAHGALPAIIHAARARYADFTTGPRPGPQGARRPILRG